MSSPRLSLVVVCVLTLLLHGCGKSSGDNANVRALNLISGVTNVNIAANGTTIMSGGTFEALSGYTGVGSGNVEFKVTVPGNTGTLIDITYGLSGNTDFTYVTTGTPGAASAVLVADAFGSPGSNVAFRVLNMSTINPSVDVYLTQPGADLTAATPVVAAAVIATVTAFANTTPGNLELRITTAGTKDVIYDALVSLPAGTGQTVVAYGRGSSKLVNAEILASGTTGGIVNNLLAQFKVVNGTAVAAPLNVLVDGTSAVTNLAFAGVTPYQTLASGVRQITVESSATPGATLLSISPDFVPATDTSLALSGGAGSLSALVLTDSNPLVATGRAELRVVNLSPDFAAVDVYANFGKLVTGLDANAASGYSLVDAVTAGTAYQIDFNTAGTTNVVLSVPGLYLAGGHVYTVYLLGSGPTLAGVLTQDR
jgi:uncharacterized protein DUF4397